MPRFGLLVTVMLLALGPSSPIQAAESAAQQTATVVATPFITIPGAPPTAPPPTPRPPRTPAPSPTRPITQATATATATAITITTAEPTAAPAATAPEAPMATTAPTATAVPTPTAVPTATAASTATAVPTATPPATPDPLATTRTVLITAPIAVAEETIGPGAPLEIPLAVPLQEGAIPPGTTIRLPNGQVLTLPAGIPIPASENPTIAGGRLNVVLQQPGPVGDTTYAPGTGIVVPSGTTLLGRVEPDATVLLRPGTVVQVAGRTQTLTEPVAARVTSAPVARPGTLPPTGDADSVLWPLGLGILLLLAGWRLRRRA